MRSPIPTAGTARKQRMGRPCRPGHFCPLSLAAGRGGRQWRGAHFLARNGDDYRAVARLLRRDAGRLRGVAFCAPRPEGFDRAAVILTDKFTPRRLAREQTLWWARASASGASGAPCSPDDPKAANPITAARSAQGAARHRHRIADGPDVPALRFSVCTSPTTYTDPDFEGQCLYAYPRPRRAASTAEPGRSAAAGSRRALPDGWPARADAQSSTPSRSQFSQAAWQARAVHGPQVARHAGVRGPDGLGRLRRQCHTPPPQELAASARATCRRRRRPSCARRPTRTLGFSGRHGQEETPRDRERAPGR